MKTKLFFSPEYGATSLANEKGQYLMTYKNLPLSLELIEELEKFDETIWEFLPDSHATMQRKKEIYENGLKLWKRVADELGIEYEVVALLDWINPCKN